ncbi:MAG: hypothetical protein ACMUIE_07385 [Thermoplasmatota archaeon]
MDSAAKKLICSLIGLVILTSGSLLFIELASKENVTVEDADGTISSGQDSYGYMWIDNKDPDPKVDFDWIDATQGTQLTKIKYRQATSQCSGSGENNQLFKLPFEFEFYGQRYTEVWVLTYGTLDFGSRYGRYTYDMPSTSYGNGVICAYGTYLGPSRYNSKIGQNFKVYALEGRTSWGERYVCFEWCNVPQYGCYDGMTFQIILYEFGLIKFQYLSMDTTYTSGNYGAYAVCGIEDHTGTVATVYSKRQAVLRSGTAIMFGKTSSEVGKVVLDTEENGALYAMHRDYTMEAWVRHPVNNDLINTVTFSTCEGLVDLLYVQNQDGSYYFSKTDPNGYMNLNVDGCTAVQEDGWIKLNFRFCPTFSYPFQTPQSVRVAAYGIGVMPIPQTILDAFWVETQLTQMGNPYAYSFERGFIENGGWVHGNEHFQIRGIKAVYPGTSITPMPGAISFIASDSEGNSYIQEKVEGECAIDIVAENDFIRKIYNITIGGLPPGSDISKPVSYQINIDPFRPQPPSEILIHADSFEDRNTLFDDDNEVFVTWEPAEDYESGILGYYLTTYDPLKPETRGEALWVASPDTSAKVQLQGVGNKKVWVWSVDKAGNPSVPEFSMTNIDTSEVTFAEFSPGNQIWINTHTPLCSVLVSDGDGSGVAAKDVQYCISTTTLEEYGSWQSGRVPRDASEIRFSVPTTLVNGKTNWIKFRGKDVAGNGWTESENYNVWVDEEPPTFTNFRPYESEYQNGRTVVVSLDLTDIHGNRAGSGVKLNTIEYRYSSGGKGLYGDWTPVEVTSVNSIYAHLELEIDFEEGTDNYIQFRVYDNVGNFATSKEFNIKVNSAPVVEAFLSEPKNGMNHLSTEKILFDASGTVDVDGDDLTYTWYSDINRFLSSSPSFFRSLSPGVHSITLVVNDPAHSVVKHFEITVYEEDQIDPMSIDSDGDGIYDDWEIMYKLNPYRPDSFLDSDNDMFTNYQEYQNGTDPTRRSSHPPYPAVIQAEGDDDDGVEEQYQAVTIAIVLISLVVIAVLLILAFSKRRNFRMDVEEEKEIEADELDYRSTIERIKTDITKR